MTESFSKSGIESRSVRFVRICVWLRTPEARTPLSRAAPGWEGGVAPAELEGVRVDLARELDNAARLDSLRDRLPIGCVQQADLAEDVARAEALTPTAQAVNLRAARGG